MVEDRGLDLPVDQRLGLPHEVLVERVLARDEDREPVPAPPCATPLLLERRHRPGEADRDRAVEQADVDPELERVGRADAEQVALHETPLDLASLLRRVARSVRREPRTKCRIVEPVDREAVDQLRGLAALREADRAEATARELGEQAGRVAERGGAHAKLLVQQLGVPEHHGALCAWRSVIADHGRLDAEQPLRELTGVRDRRRGEQELRLRAVHRGRAAQAAKDVADVGAEDASVHVRLVDDDIAEVLQDVPPAVVMREHADVEHVRVGEDQVRPLADLPAALAFRVAVVDRRLHARHGETGERAQLILRECFGRVEVQRAGLRLARERVEHGQVESEGFPRRGSRRDDHVLPAARGLPSHLPGARRARRARAAHGPAGRARPGSARSVRGAEARCGCRRSPRLRATPPSSPSRSPSPPRVNSTDRGAALRG